MTILVVLVLCVVWAAYLVPPMLRGRSVAGRRGAGHRLSAIGSAAARVLKDSHYAEPTPAAHSTKAAPAHAARTTTGLPAHSARSTSHLRDRGFDSLVPASAAAARQRRILVFGVLGALALISLFALAFVGPAALVLHLAFDALLGAMGYLTYQRSTTRGTTPVVRSLDFHRQVQHQRNESSSSVQLSENELARRIAN